MPDTPVQRVVAAELPAAMRDAWQRSMDIRSDATFIEALGNAPELFDWYSGFYRQVFYGGRVEASVKELLRLRLSTRHGCRSCNLGNRRDAVAAGIDPAKLEAIDQANDSVFDERELSVLALADEMALESTDGALSRDLYDRLRQHFDDGQIMELGMTMAVLVGMAKFLFVFDLVEREAPVVIGTP